MSHATIGYGRVSTASGEQLSALRSQLAWLEDQRCDRVLHDVESGLHVDRPAYTTLLQEVASGKVGVIRATRADRLGRDANELVRLVQLADSKGVLVETRDDGTLSAKTAEELLLLFVRAALAQGESMKISARVHGGLEQGRRLGKPMRKPCWGYQLTKDKLALEPDPETFPRARRMIDHLIANNWRLLPSLSSFPEPVPITTIRGLRAWLLNPTIRGGIAYGQLPNHQFKEVLWDRHTPLISHDEYAAYERQAKLNRRSWGANVKLAIAPLTGLCVCAECNHKLKYITGRKHKSLRCGGDTCSQLYKGTREELIIRYALSALTTQAAEILAASADQSVSPEIIELQRQIDALDKLNDPDTQLIIKSKKARLQSLILAPKPNQDLIAQIAHPEWADHATRDDLIPIFHGLIESITITKQQPTAIKLRI